MALPLQNRAGWHGTSLSPWRFAECCGSATGEYDRAVGGNGLSWAYTFEWPLFAGFAVVFWARTIRDEFQMRRGGVSETELMRRAAMARSMATLPSGAILPAGELPDGVSILQLEQAAYDDKDDLRASPATTPTWRS